MKIQSFPRLNNGLNILPLLQSAIYFETITGGRALSPHSTHRLLSVIPTGMKRRPLCLNPRVSSYPFFNKANLGVVNGVRNTPYYFASSSFCLHPSFFCLISTFLL